MTPAELKEAITKRMMDEVRQIERYASADLPYPCIPYWEIDSIVDDIMKLLAEY